MEGEYGEGFIRSRTPIDCLSVYRLGSLSAPQGMVLSIYNIYKDYKNKGR